MKWSGSHYILNSNSLTIVSEYKDVINILRKKGNMKDGRRRRRLDFRTARAILENAYQSLNVGDNYEKQLGLF